MRKTARRIVCLELAVLLIGAFIPLAAAAWSVTVNVNEYSRIVLCSAQSEDDVLSLPELADGSAWPRGMLPGEDRGDAILYGTPTETGVFRLSGSVYDSTSNGYIMFDVTVTVVDPKATPSPSPTASPTPSPAPSPTPAPTATPEPTAVLAAAADTATATPEPTATPAPEPAGKTGGNVLVIVLLAVIAVLAAAGVVMAIRLRRNGRGGGSHRR